MKTSIVNILIIITISFILIGNLFMNYSSADNKIKQINIENIEIEGSEIKDISHEDDANVI